MWKKWLSGNPEIQKKGFNLTNLTMFTWLHLIRQKNILSILLVSKVKGVGFIFEMVFLSTWSYLEISFHKIYPTTWIPSVTSIELFWCEFCLNHFISIWSKNTLEILRYIVSGLCTNIYPCARRYVFWVYLF